MLTRIGFVVGGIVLSMFAMGRVESLAAHHSFGGATAWAQGWDDPADDADVDSQPSVVIPVIAGSYSGPAVDHRFGNGTISATIAETASGVLSGSWSTDLNGGASGSLTGKVKPNSSVKLKLKIHGHCGIIAHGTFENGNEIVGVYHLFGCGKPDHGHFDITD